MILIKPGIAISPADIIYRFSRSSGPGGQNVNKLNTKVILLFDIANSRGLSREQKQLVYEKLSSRVTDDGFVKITSQRHRTQRANRKAALEKLEDLLSDALKETPVREETEIPVAIVRREQLAFVTR